MNFNEHSDLEGEHAFLGASKYHWINYTDEDIAVSYNKYMRIQLGTWFHAFAACAISRMIKVPKNRKNLMQLIEVFLAAKDCPAGVISAMYDLNDEVFLTIISYVNDAIGYKMKAEQVLRYSEICFGTADAISFNNKVLRIHDLKSGNNPGHMEQLMIYAALFCLEYKIKINDITIELRIYQQDEIIVYNPTVEDLMPIADKIVRFDRIIRQIKEEG